MALSVSTFIFREHEHVSTWQDMLAHRALGLFIPDVPDIAARIPRIGCLAKPYPGDTGVPIVALTGEVGGPGYVSLPPEAMDAPYLAFVSLDVAGEPLPQNEELVLHVVKEPR